MLTLSLLLISCGEDAQPSSETFAFPDVGVISVKNGWNRSEIGARNNFIGTSWTKSNAQCADYNGDGKIDYLRVVSPPDSYEHYILIDGDFDGYFDEAAGSTSDTVLSDKNLSVPRLIDK